MREIYKKSQTAIDAIDAIAVSVASVLLFALMVIVVFDVGLRYLFNAPITWSYETIEHFLMPGLFFLSASHTLCANSHVAVDIIHNYLPDRKRYVLEAISHALSTPAFALATYFSALQTLDQFREGTQLGSGLELPTWTTSVLLPVGFGLLSLRALLKAVGFAASIGAREPLAALPAISGTEENYE